ncbi:MAG TPA: glycerol-3-phosphate ABC transporter permease [Acidimicrobiaceae bacterium]|nr:glycerol-3-phosphate ABC transporter permease [Acidimicrobiaceae bacterium]
MKRRLRDVPGAVAMLLPSMLLLAVWTVYPLVKAFINGTKSCDSTGTRCTDVGWQQYSNVWSSREFQDALAVSLKLALMTVPTGLILGVGLAVLADKHLRGIGFFRTVFSSTVATSVAVASLVWVVLLQPEIGVLSDLFSGWIPSLKNPGLLRDPGTALPAVALSSVWANLGFTFIVVTAGLQSIPRDLYESAYVDGASSWRRFTNVTLPMLTPSLLFIVVVLTTRALQAYGEIALLTQGGPNPEKSTTTIPYLIYGENSLIRNNLGLKSAAAVLLFLVSLVFAVVQYRGFEKRVQYAR